MFRHSVRFLWSYPGGDMSDLILDAGLEARRVSRREFIKRVIASGAVASSASFVMLGVSGWPARGSRFRRAAGVDQRER
jgi:hypothetical protein